MLKIDNTIVILPISKEQAGRYTREKESTKQSGRENRPVRRNPNSFQDRKIRRATEIKLHPKSASVST